MVNLTADEIITLLNLQPHPEGGHYRETFRDAREVEGRAFSTAIYFLLRGGEVSRWHRVDAAEIWHWYAGDPLELIVAGEGQEAKRHTLGPNLLCGERPQAVARPALAASLLYRRVDARWLHGRPRLHVWGVRAGALRLRAPSRTSRWHSSLTCAAYLSTGGQACGPPQHADSNGFIK